MGPHNICFCGQIRKISIFFGLKKKSIFSRAMNADRDTLWYSLYIHVCCTVSRGTSYEYHNTYVFMDK